MLNKLEEAGISWLIIGACTGRKHEIMELAKRYPDLIPMPYGKIWTLQPKIEWVEEIVRAADKAGIPVFLKDNLRPLVEQYDDKEHLNLQMGEVYILSRPLRLIQEMPVEK